MCHPDAPISLPPPGDFATLSDGVEAFTIGSDGEHRLAILPDIYGCNDFYRSLATHFSEQGAWVALVNPFAGLGELAEVTREAAFERRHQVRDREFLDRFTEFCARQKISGIIGFCLGGLYVFDLARRHVAASLVALYPFPQGLPNQDSLQVPFEYLSSVDKSHTVLVGDQDHAMADGVLERLQRAADENDAIDLRVFQGSDHGFLSDLDSENAQLRSNAQEALGVCESVLLS